MESFKTLICVFSGMATNLWCLWDMLDASYYCMCISRRRNAIYTVCVSRRRNALTRSFVVLSVLIHIQRQKKEPMHLYIAFAAIFAKTKQCNWVLKLTYVYLDVETIHTNT